MLVFLGAALASARASAVKAERHEFDAPRQKTQRRNVR